MAPWFLSFLSAFLFFSLHVSPLSGQKNFKKQRKELSNLIDQSPVFNRHFAGFIIEDAATEEVLFSKDADKYFTPASNTKLVTFYTALKILGDSLNVWRVAEFEDQIILQGTGNPLWRHPSFKEVVQPEPWKKGTLPVRISFDNWRGTRFGRGWSWSDYPYYYQTERSPLPFHGNYIQFSRDTSGKWGSTPGSWLNEITINHNDLGEAPKINRNEFDNVFYANKKTAEAPFNLLIPYRTDNESVLKIFREDLQRPVSLFTLPRGSNLVFTDYKIPIPDTLYRFFLQESDNFIGEQLLVSCSDKLFGYLDPDKLIQYAMDSLLSDLPQKPVWVDGSGLSRYNLFSPNDMTVILKKLLRLMPRERLFNLLPAGGISGTISTSYQGTNGKPFVFAKTGSLSNNHCLSGFVTTNSGKVLIFSFMNNHFVGGSAVVKKEMNKVLTYLRDYF
jgi:D-alanyl-D-alanine carboxypeptidase/D-alanyl-D-alanine-endopeptidase (penicillin-binding protein 4)